jgi:hypothetical protein
MKNNFRKIELSYGQDREALLEALRVGEWRSLVAHLVWDQRVVGSNPISPTTLKSGRDRQIGHQDMAMTIDFKAFDRHTIFHKIKLL